MPFFSVIIPCYNAEETLMETLSSVACQSFKDFEVIIVDDGSTDSTPHIADGFVKAYNNFRYIRTPNRGPSEARNLAAFSYAQGSILAFLDADDVWYENKLLRMAEIFNAKEAPDAAFANVGFFRENNEIGKYGAKSGVLPITIGNLSVFSFLNGNPVCTMSNMVVRKSSFLISGGFDTKLRYAEDVEWMVRLVASGARLRGFNETLVFYRSSDAGLSSNFMAMQQGWCETLKTIQKCEPSLTDADIAAAEAAHLRYLARRALRLETPRGTAAKLAGQALAKNPTGYFTSGTRGALTLAAACAEPLMPRALRKSVFAD